MVHSVDKTSAQLRSFLESGKDIIISTIQKFSVIAETIGELKSKTFAVIIDEVHSSQSGESAKNLRASLSKGIEGGVAEDDGEVSDMDARIIGRDGTAPGAGSYLLFRVQRYPEEQDIGTIRAEERKRKIPTVPRLFDAPEYQRRLHARRAAELHHLQAVFSTWFKRVPEDKDYEKRRTIRKLTNYVDLQPHSIETKTRIILEHFVDRTANTIEGEGKGDADHTVSIALRQIQAGVRSGRCGKWNLPLRLSLVAFSNTVHDTDVGRDYTENGMNNLAPSVSIADTFKRPDYRISDRVE